MTDTFDREQAVAVAQSSDEKVMINVQELEAYVSQNKGMIMGYLTSLPTPLLMIVRSIVKIILIPLDYVVTLPLTKISSVLRDFATKEPTCPPLPSNSSDCAPTQIV